MKCYTVASLFSGAGGLDLGFGKRFVIKFANDIRKIAAETYSLNFNTKIINVHDHVWEQNGVYLLGSVEDLNLTGAHDGEVDVVIGGPPCQDFSVVRGPTSERRGVEVKRGQLYTYFVRAVVYLSPKVFVFENVPGLVSANGGLAYKTIIEDFSKLRLRWNEIKTGKSKTEPPLGYCIIFAGIVNAADLGVPQNRRRLIIIGVRSDLLRELGYLDEVKRKAIAILSGARCFFNKYPLTALEALEGYPLPDLSEEYRSIMKDYDGVAELVGTDYAINWREKIWNKLKFDIVEDYLTLCGIKKQDKDELEEAFKEHEKILRELGYYGRKLEGQCFSDGSNRLANEAEEVIERLRMIPPGENHEFVRGTKWEVEGKGMSLIYRRLHPLRLAYTVVAFGGGGTGGYHYRRSRSRITNRERARLQSFPDSFLFSGSESEIRAQIGEAVPPLMSKRIAEVVELILKKVG